MNVSVSFSQSGIPVSVIVTDGRGLVLARVSADGRKTVRAGGQVGRDALALAREVLIAPHLDSKPH